MRGIALPIALLVCLPALPSAQSNADPSIDVELGILGGFSWLDRAGAFPNGINGAAMSTTVCNKGDVVPWFAAMNPNHPVIAFLAARVTDERIVQISDKSHVKHGFFALTSSQCTPCNPPGGTPGTFLGIGCSDTYSVGNNSDNFWLGPPEEIDPWLGGWDPVCSYFDMGDPPVPPSFQCDGNRSLTGSQANALNPVGNRMRITDAELNEAGTFYYQAQYVISTEPENVRNDNLGSRQFVPSWEGTFWNFSEPPDVVKHGTILGRWSGAKLSSATNGGDDGRVYVAVKVTGPTEGLYHYEYAFHNRDNSRGVDEIRIPICSGARVLNAGFRDVDQSGANDWTSSIESGGTELVFQDSVGGNALEWNSIYNVWFDSDAAPATADLTLAQAQAGAGAPSFTVDARSPVVLFNVFSGPGCSFGTPATLYAVGTPAHGTLGNLSLALESSGNVPGEPHLLLISDSPNPGSLMFGSCTFWLDGNLGIEIYGISGGFADGSGVVVHPTPIPNDVALEGLDFAFQALTRNTVSGGPIVGVWELTDGIRLRLGDNIPDCP